MRLSRRSEPFDSDEFIYELKIYGFGLSINEFIGPSSMDFLFLSSDSIRQSELLHEANGTRCERLAEARGGPFWKHQLD